MNQPWWFTPSWISLPPPTPSHPSRLWQSAGFELPASYSTFPRAIYFARGNVYVSMLLFQFVPPSPSWTVSASLFSTSVSPLLPCRWVHLHHLSRFHVYALICVFFSFWFASLCTLGFRFLEPTHRCSFLWVSSIPLYICARLLPSRCLYINVLGCHSNTP